MRHVGRIVGDLLLSLVVLVALIIVLLTVAIALLSLAGWAIA